jgi:hypothetical protein
VNQGIYNLHYGKFEKPINSRYNCPQTISNFVVNLKADVE